MLKQKLLSLKNKVGTKGLVIGIIIVALIIFFVGKMAISGCQSNDVIINGAAEVETQNGDEEKPSGKIFVDISGAIKNEGVYEMSVGDRVVDLIKKAGGLKKNADTSNLNRARLLEDGEKIFIPTIATDGGSGSESGTSPNTSAKVNINTATSEQLQTLNGIGPSKANAIIDYREKVRRFSKIEDILNVSGIGEATFNNIKDKITV